MAKRRKRRYRDEDGEVDYRMAPRKRRRQFEGPDAEAGLAVAERAERPKPPVTCYQCSHLVVTRSFVKHVSQSWDRAIVFPTLTCFQQCWTLEDPDSVDDKAAVSEYLVGNAETCPNFLRGHPRSHEW